MPSLPRIRTRRVGPLPHAVDVARQPQLAELDSDGLTWIHLERPSQDEAQELGRRFGWHPLDIEDVMSRRERPKVDVYSEEEATGYLFAVLHFPVYNTGVGRLDAGQLERQIERFLPEELELYFDDIVDANERIWDHLDNYKEVVEALEDTNESLISHQQNDILYVLTIFSVVMLPLTFITGFFGMNVRFPGFDSTTGFLTTIASMVVVVGAMLGFFRWKKWL